VPTFSQYILPKLQSTPSINKMRTFTQYTQNKSIFANQPSQSKLNLPQTKVMVENRFFGEDRRLRKTNGGDMATAC
jgi:hypothetical protein